MRLSRDAAHQEQLLELAISEERVRLAASRVERDRASRRLPAPPPAAATAATDGRGDWKAAEEATGGWGDWGWEGEARLAALAAAEPEYYAALCDEWRLAEEYDMTAFRIFSGCLAFVAV